MNRVLLCLLLLAAISCGRSEPADDRSARLETGSDEFSATQSRAENPPDPVSTNPRIVILGDSLTAGLGLAQEHAYPALLQRKLKEDGSPLEVINAGVSGDTSSDGLRRVTWALDGNVRLLIIALGGNDGLRGLPVEQMKENLQRIIDRARQRGIPVLLIGMEAPPNYGEQYVTAFRQVFQDLVRENTIAFVPFLLEGVAGVRGLNQPDGIHPNRAGAERIAEHLWPAVKKMLESTR